MGKVERKSFKKSTLGNSLLLLIIAVLAFVAVTYAWFTISDNARLSSMKMDITTGLSLRMDVDPHEEFESYKQTLKFADIAQRIRADLGVDIATVPIEPVTTKDGVNFVFEDGSPARAADGTYVEFTLHFMSMGDMYVHLTSTSSKNANDGTRVWSNSTPELVQAMRISFTWEGGSFMYDPADDNIAGLTYDNVMFFLPEATDLPVVVRIWLEGTDPACDNKLKGSDYSVSLRFEGSDENNNPLR